MSITLGSKIIFWQSTKSWLFTWHVIVHLLLWSPICWIQKCPEEGWPAWQCLCHLWGAGTRLRRKNASHELHLWFGSSRTEQQLPDACCYFCLCCWHRGSYGLFTGRCFVSLCSPAQAQLWTQGHLLLWMDTVSIGRCWALWNLCWLRPHSLVLCKSLLCLTAEFVQGTVYLC